MEVLLLIIAGVVLYYLYGEFQNYMKNPYKPGESGNGGDYKSEYNKDDNPYIQLSDEDKIRDGEYGILARILKSIASSDGEVCHMEKELLKNMLDDIAEMLPDFKNAREDLQNIFDKSNDDLDSLAESFCEMTKGEYKKRLKVVEFLFAVAYADGELSEIERTKIIDVAAIFELNNDDFNKIYDDFESEYNNEIELEKGEAMAILGLSDGFSKDELESAYTQKIKENKQNILLNKNLDKNFSQKSAAALRKIDKAYEILSKDF